MNKPALAGLLVIVGMLLIVTAWALDGSGVDAPDTPHPAATRTRIPNPGGRVYYAWPERTAVNYAEGHIYATSYSRPLYETWTPAPPVISGPRPTRTPFVRSTLRPTFTAKPPQATAPPVATPLPPATRRPIPTMRPTATRTPPGVFITFTPVP